MKRIFGVSILLILVSPYSIADQRDMSVCYGASKWMKPPTRHYPTSEQGTRHSGDVQIDSVVDLDGNVISASVSKSSGWSGLDNAALSAIKDSRYKPLYCKDNQASGTKDFSETFSYDVPAYDLPGAPKPEPPPPSHISTRTISLGTPQGPRLVGLPKFDKLIVIATQEKIYDVAIRLEVVYDKYGHVIDTNILNSSGNTRLDTAAAAWAKGITVNGAPFPNDKNIGTLPIYFKTTP